MAAMTIRKHAIAMNTFFRFLSTRSLMHGPMIILELPSKSLKPEVRIRPDSSRMKMFDRLMQKVQEHQIEKSRKKYRMSEGQQYMNHLRAWWVMDTTGMRLALGKVIFHTDTVGETIPNQAEETRKCTNRRNEAKSF